MTKQERLAKDGYDNVTPVLFYSPHDKNGEGSNYSQHGLFAVNPFTDQVEWYPTGEHRFQAMKATTNEDHVIIKEASTPDIAKKLGRGIDLREGWGNSYGDLCWYVMLETLFLKTKHNKAVQHWLWTTGNHPIYEDSPVDDIWGWRYKEAYNGKNLLGRAWMEVRRANY